MDFDTEVVDLLQRDDYGWSWKLPPTIFFRGERVLLEIHTRLTPARNAPPRPSPSELALARSILAEITQVLATADQEYERYNADDPEALATIAQPTIWISREDQEQDGPERWALVVSSHDDSDWGCHLEFNGTTFHVAWSGD